MMIVAVVAGVLSFLRLGRGEDPAITIRTMIVAAAWPGATVEETLKQVTERLERTLQETRHLDRVRSYTTAGQTTIFVDLKQNAPPAEIADVWYNVRKNVGDMRGTLPQGVVGPFFNDDFGDTFGIIYAFTADGFTFRELRDYVEAARSRLLQVPDVSKIEVLGAQDEQVFIEFSTERLAGTAARLPDDPRDAAGAEPRAAGRRHPDRSRSACSCASPARSTTSATSRTSTSCPATASSAWATSRRCGAASSIRRSRCSASTASPRSASRSRCATPATSWRSATTSAPRWTRSARTCPSASSRCWSPTRRSPWTSRSTTS